MLQTWGETQMGLALAFKPGEDFFVNDERFVVERVTSPTAFIVRRDKDGVEFSLSDGHSHEILPQVVAAVNLRGQGNLARLDLTAPRSVNLATGENYRRAKPRISN
jgi:hypothetical protein